MRLMLLALTLCLLAFDSHAQVAPPQVLLAQADTGSDPGAGSPDAVDPEAVDPDAAPDEPGDSATDKPEQQGTAQTGDPVLGPSGLPEVYYGDAALPEPVRRMRERLLEAAQTGDIEKLRPFLEAGDQQPVISVGEGRGDPIDFLKSQSGDPEGREILAILTEVLQAGYIHLDPGKPQEAYVWPYFAYYPLDKLSPPQMVELFKIITGQDFADMKEYGAYVFFRLGISPDGKWQFFISGD